MKYKYMLQHGWIQKTLFLVKEDSLKDHKLYDFIHMNFLEKEKLKIQKEANYKLGLIGRV